MNFHLQSNPQTVEIWDENRGVEQYRKIFNIRDLYDLYFTIMNFTRVLQKTALYALILKHASLICEVCDKNLDVYSTTRDNEDTTPF